MGKFKKCGKTVVPKISSIEKRVRIINSHNNYITKNFAEKSPIIFKSESFINIFVSRFLKHHLQYIPSPHLRC